MPRITSLFLLLFPVSLLSFAPAAHAQLAAEEAADKDGEGWSGFIAIGPGVAPKFDGADSYRIIPLAIGTVRNGDVAIDFQGSRLRADVIPAVSFAAGPVVNVRLGRDDDAGGRVGLLNKIDTAVELGGFAGLRLGGDARGQGQVQLDLTALADVSGAHDGFLVTGSAAYNAIRSEIFSLSVDTQATWGSRQYMRTYFGVTAPEARIANLQTYRPGASLRDVGAGATLGYQFNQRWGLIGRLSWSYLVGDPADSPIVREEGSRHQGLAGLTVSYRF